MPKAQVPDYADNEVVTGDFNFKTFKDMVEVFGKSRAASLLHRARQQKTKQAPRQTLTLEDIEVTRKFLGLKDPAPGERVGQQSSKALKVFRAYITSDTAGRSSLIKFLNKTEDSLRGKAPQAPALSASERNGATAEPASAGAGWPRST